MNWFLLLTLFASFSSCVAKVDKPMMPPVIEVLDGVKVRADSHHLVSYFLSQEENNHEDELDLLAAALDGKRALQAIHWQCPLLPNTLTDFSRTKSYWGSEGSGVKADHREGLYVYKTDGSPTDQMWVNSFTDLRLVAHEFCHMMEWRMLPEGFYAGIPCRPTDFLGVSQAWWKVQTKPPTGVFPTHYSRVNQVEWFCETYGSLVALATQLGGPLIKHRDTLDLAAFTQIADHCVTLNILRKETAAFIERVTADAESLDNIEAVQRILSNQGRLHVWGAGLTYNLGASSWHKLSACSAAPIAWQAVMGFQENGEGAQLAWANQANLALLDQALHATYQLLAMTRLDPAHLVASISVLHDKGAEQAARDLATQAIALAARAWTHPDDPNISLSRAALDEAMREVVAIEPSETSFTDLQLDRHLLHLVRAIVACPDLPAHALTVDPMPEVLLILKQLSPPESFYRYTGLSKS